MLRYANSSDIPTLKQLLHTVFGTSESFINLFFRLAFDNNVCIYEYEGQIVSMAFLLPAKIQLNSEEHKATYLYACATLDRFRGRGFMRAIIEKIYADICARNEAALFVMPAEESLYPYYESCGFKPYFYCREQHFYLHNFQWQNGPKEFGIQKITAREYAEQRRRLLTSDGTVHWPVNHLKVIEEVALKSREGFYTITLNNEPRTYCIVRPREYHLEITEYIGEWLTDVEALFFRTFGYSHIVTYSPGGDKKNALARFNPSFNKDTNGKGYCNIFLD